MGLAFPPVRVGAAPSLTLGPPGGPDPDQLADGWQASAGGALYAPPPPLHPPGNPTNGSTGTQSDEREGSKLGERTRAMRRGKTERERERGRNETGIRQGDNQITEWTEK